MSNYAVHHLVYVPANEIKYLVIVSIIDFVIVIPALTYFFIYRKKGKLAPIIGVALSGYIVGTWIIPDIYLSEFEWIGWLLLIGELSIFSLEFFIIYKLIQTIRKVRKNMNDYNGIVPSSIAIWNHLDETFADQHLAKMIASELMMFKHALASFRNKVVLTERHFTAHQNTSIIAFYIMLIHAIVLETVGLHWLIHEWNPILSWIGIVLNVYTVFFFIGEIQAIRLNPITVERERITIPFGLIKRVTIPKESITSIRKPSEGEYNEKEKDVFHGIHIDFEKGVPNVVIDLYEPIDVYYMYGFRRKVKKVYLKLDRPNEFFLKVKEDGYPVEEQS